MQWAQAHDKGPWLQIYAVPGNCTSLGFKTTEGCPSWSWQAGGGSFLLLPMRHVLSSLWLWTFNHNTCENRLEEVQGAATSCLFPPPLYQDTWSPVELLCVERNAPCQWDLATDKAKPPTSAAKWQGNDQTDLQCQAARHYHHQIQWATCATWREGSAGMDMWNALVMVQSRQPFLTYRLMEGVDLGGPRWHGSSWQRGFPESGSSRLSILMIDIPGDLVWDLPCVQQASYMEGALWCGCCPCTCMLIKNPMMMMMMMMIKTISFHKINVKDDFNSIEFFIWKSWLYRLNSKMIRTNSRGLNDISTKPSWQKMVKLRLISHHFFRLSTSKLKGEKKNKYKHVRK